MATNQKNAKLRLSTWKYGNSCTGTKDYTNLDISYSCIWGRLIEDKALSATYLMQLLVRPVGTVSLKWASQSGCFIYNLEKFKCARKCDTKFSCKLTMGLLRPCIFATGQFESGNCKPETYYKYNGPFTNERGGGGLMQKAALKIFEPLWETLENNSVFSKNRGYIAAFLRSDRVA